jgi:2-polyprenyl-3-methyl-5-hydroxy-6-metoxy-1,4-benzoquinol methylase
VEQLQALAAKIGKQHYRGSSTKVGKLYHNIPFEDYNTHRKGTEQRTDLIQNEMDIKGKRGLDIGCSVGGISFYLQQAGAIMRGVDYDPAVIDFAIAVATKYECAVDFVNKEIDAEFVSNLGIYDFIIWFDNWMWIEKQHGYTYACDLLAEIAAKTNILFFSTSQNDGQAKGKIKTADDVFKLLKRETGFFDIRNLGVVKDGWHKRSMFVCTR